MAIEPAETTLFAPGERLLRLRDVKEKTMFGTTTIYRYMKTLGFPQPIRFAPQMVRWRESDIDAWIDAAAREGQE